MTAAQWIAEARASGLSVYLDPRPAEQLFYLQRPLRVPGMLDPEPYRPEAWPQLDASLEAVGPSAIFAELKREVRRA